MVAVFAGGQVAAADVIDEFTTNQGPVSDPVGTPSSVATGGADILGQRRDVTVRLLAGAGPAEAEAAGGILAFIIDDTTPDSRAEAVITWDADADPNVLDADGLAPLDLTGSEETAFAITVDAADAGTELVLEVYTDAANMSRAALVLPMVVSPTVFHLAYKNDFVARLGTGADFADVGAIVLTVRGTEIAIGIDQVETVAASLVATKTDLTPADAEIGATPQVPGATIKYRVTLTNTGGEALAVDLTDMIDANTTLAAATVDATPVAVDDAYEAFGNVAKTVSAGQGLLANDVDPDQNGVLPELVVDVSGSPLATALGGTATLAVDGSFTYEPPVGVGSAVDTFDYTVTDNEGNAAVATAKVHLGRVVWFVDDAHPGADLGTRDDPFVGLTAANLAGPGGGGDQDGPGDILYFYAGTHPTGNLQLEAGQELIGAGIALVVDGETILAAGSHPTLTHAAGTVVSLATDNRIRGLHLGNAAAGAFRLAGTAFGTLFMSDGSITGTGGALSLTNGTATVTLSGITATSPSVRGILLDAVGGSLGVTGSTSVTSSVDDSLRIANAPAGASYSFGTTVLSTNGAADGLELVANHASASTSFTSLAVTTNNGTGLFGSSGGVLNVGGSGNTIVSTGTAVALLNTNLGAGATFSTVSSSSSPGSGISLNGVTGAFTATGGSITGAAGIAFDVNAGTGAISYTGLITNAASRAVEVTDRTTSTVTLSGTVSDAGTGILISSNSGGTVTLSGNYSGTAASSQIDVVSNSGTAVVNFTGSSKTLSTGASNAIDVTSNGTATVNFTGGGLAITTTSGVGFNATGGAAGVTVQGSGNTITSTTGAALNVVSTTIGAADLTFERISAGTGVSGPANGIVLNNTGALGGLTVTGTAGAGSGGTIQRTTGVGILLTSTSDVSFSFVNVQNAGDDGIRGQGVNNFSLINCNLTTNGNATAENGLQFGEASGTVAGITGTLTLTNTSITGSAGNNVHIRNTSGTLTAMNVSGSSFNDLNDVTGANSFLFEMSGTATTTSASIANSTFSNNSPQRALEVQAHQDATISDFTVSGSTFNDNGIHASFTQDTTADLTFSMLNNTSMLNANPLHAINVFSSSTSTGGSITGTIEGNVIGNAAVANSGARGNGIRAFIQGRTTAVLRIHGNTLRQIWDTTNGARGIDLQFVGPVAVGQPITQSDVTVTNNNVDTMAPASSFPTAAIYLAADDQGSPARVRAVATGNTAVNSVGGGSFDYPTFDGNGAHLVFIEVGGAAVGQLVGTGADNATAELMSSNTGTVFTQGITEIPGPISTP
jgi:hypothetical protein